jgi:hypothetical protein
MDAQEDAELRLATFRHPAARVAGSLHQAQRRLDEAAAAFCTVMVSAGAPGSRPLPPPGERAHWPRGHQARKARGWLLPVPVETGLRCWIDTGAHWWLVRVDGDGRTRDAHTVGTPLRRADELPAYRDAFESILADSRVSH